MRDKGKNAGRRPRKRLILSLLWDCNQRCSFCAKGPRPAGAERLIPPGKVLELLRAGRRDGYDGLSLDGGEPTLYPDLARLVARALGLGYGSVNILTNGMALADSGLLRALGRPRLRERVVFCVSLHSHLAAVSDRLTATPGAFARTLAGLGELRDSGFEFSLYSVITTLNWRRLPAYAAFVAEHFPQANSVTFSYLFPAGYLREGLALYPRLVPTAPALAAAAALLRSRGIRPELSACGLIPLCLARGNERLLLGTAMESGERHMTFDTHKMEPFPFFDAAFNNRNKRKGPACGGCAVAGVCGGIWNFYADKYGFSELRPFAAEHFKALPGSGSASLDLSSCSGAAEPWKLAMMNLIALRYKGFSRLTLLNEAALGDRAPGLKAFARAAGFVLPRAPTAGGAIF